MSRIEREQKTIEAMLRLYCRHHHAARHGLCSECAALHDYARRRLDNCPFHELKPACNHCTVHCYSVGMREQVRAVMRYAGPRMTLRHPWLAVLHLLDRIRPAARLTKKV